MQKATPNFCRAGEWLVQNLALSSVSPANRATKSVEFSLRVGPEGKTCLKHLRVREGLCVNHQRECRVPLRYSRC